MDTPESVGGRVNCGDEMCRDVCNLWGVVLCVCAGVDCDLMGQFVVHR